MCGISAVVDFQRGGGIASALLRMHELLRHRGPDGEGYLWLDAHCRAHGVSGTDLGRPEIGADARFAAAFRWLKIQDRDDASSQPMCSPDRRLWLLFNGEIYNHADLRQELSRHGYEFRTGSDTEVLLAAYRRWGRECVSRLRGMWALVLLDLERRSLCISRDRLGIKPLFFSREGSLLLLASEAKAIALARASGVRAEAFRIHEFLRGFPPQSAGLTFFRDVHPVPAATWSEISLAPDASTEIVFRPYWALSDYRSEDVPETFFESKREEFEAVLRSSVSEHSRAAVEVGTLLSGGLDTSTLASMLADEAAAAGKEPPQAFSIIYEDPEMSEWPYMQLVLAKAGLRGVNATLTASQAWGAVPQVVWAQGQPLLGQDIIAQFHAYRLAREHATTVVLDGQGVDELLGGMPLYEAQIFPDLLLRGRLLRFVDELRARMRRYAYSPKQALDIYLRAPIVRKWMEDHGLPRYDWLDRKQVDSSRFGAGRTADWGPERSAFARFLYRHVRHTNLPQILTLQDHSSMAHAVESRVPFLDHRLVELVFRLPDSFKLRDGVRKRILLETARKYVPEAVANRKDKRVFVSKLSWMNLRGRFATELREMAESSEIRDFGLVDHRRVARFVSDYLSGRNDDEMAVWRLYTLWQWLRVFRVRL